GDCFASCPHSLFEPPVRSAMLSRCHAFAIRQNRRDVFPHCFARRREENRHSSAIGTNGASIVDRIAPVIASAF
ncbi:hypothetical protein NDN95_26435, partial [Burkholderia glumae]